MTTNEVRLEDVTIKFETIQQADRFVAWFSNSGEQDYFEQREYEDNPNDIVNIFEYEDNIITGKNIKEEDE